MRIFNAYLPALVILFSISLFCNAQSIKLEAENGTLTGTLTKATSVSGYSGTGYVRSFDSTTDTLTLFTTLQQEGTYKIFISYAALSGDKVNNIRINGSTCEFKFKNSNGTFKELFFTTLKLKPGLNRLGLIKNWGGIYIDYFRLEPTYSETSFYIPNQLVTPNPTEEAKSLFKFLLDTFTDKTISGAMTQDHSNSIIMQQIEVLHTQTGKYPVLLGFDFMNHTREYSYYNKWVNINEAIKWSRKNGIVAFNWHWRDPLQTTNEFYTSGTTFNITKIADPSSAEYKAMIKDIDTIANYLKVFQDSLVPVLFRPLHEAAGGWFWWGAKGAASCKALWQLLFDRLVNYHGIHNLIWVWTTNTMDDALTWYPGDNYVDIIGMDLYQLQKGDTESLGIAFKKIKEDFSGHKIITLSENGTIPDPDKMKTDNAGWSYYMTWYGEYLSDGLWNPASHLQKVYNHDHILTLDEMPDLKTYPSTGPGLSITKRPLASNIFKISIDRTSESLLINSPDNYTKYNVFIFDIMGRLYHHSNGNIGDISIPVNELKTGIYIINITNTEGQETFKIFK